MVTTSFTGRMEKDDAAQLKAQELADFVKGDLPKFVKQLELESQNLPVDQDFHFYSNFKAFKSPVKDIQNRVVSLLCKFGALEFRGSSSSDLPADPDEAYDWLVGVQDDLLERVDASLDKFHLERKGNNQMKAELPRNQVSAVNATPSPRDVKMARKDKTPFRGSCPVPFHVQNIARPQDKFDTAVDNYTPFKHPRKLAFDLDENMEEHEAVSSEVSAKNGTKVEQEGLAGNVHPLEAELKEMAYMEPLSERPEAREPRSLKDTPFTFVSSLASLKCMADKLRSAGEIAVDLENHHYRSYLGFVCLMQVSTRDEDFVVDTLALRSNIGPCLGDIFADSKIRKVFHGADCDIVWLQRDFGIYVCNMFDTGQAARVLQCSGAGLAYLLEHFCGVVADKRYQLADWRIRPLPKEMLTYAREDTHYLLFIHDLLKQRLFDMGADAKFDGEHPWTQVCRRSRDICLQLYSTEPYSETGYLDLHGLYEKQFRPDQLSAVAKLYAWRDQLARKEDESTGYVLPNHLLLKLATEMPETSRELQWVAGNGGAQKVHSYVKFYAGVLADLIRQAKENPILTTVQPRVKPGREQTLQGEAVEGETIVDPSDSNSAVNLSPSADVDMSPISKMVGTAPSIFTSEDGDELVGERDGFLEKKTEMIKSDQKAEETPGPVVVSRKAGSMLFSSKRSKSDARSFPPIVSAVPRFVEPAESVSPLKPDASSVVQHDASENIAREGTSEVTEAGSVEKGKSVTQPDLEVLSAKEPVASSLLVDHPSFGQTSTYDRGIPSVDEASSGPGSNCAEIGLLTTSADASLLHGELREGLVDTKSPSSHEEATALDTETQARSKIVPEVKLKGKTKGFGASLFGRSRQQLKGLSQPATLTDQVQARLKAQAVESTISLPFKASTTPVDDAVCSAGMENSEGVEAPKIITIEADSSEHAGSSEKQKEKVVLDDVIMLENKGGEENDMLHGATEQGRHRTWWPPARKERTPAGAREGSLDVKSKKPERNEASETNAEQRDPSFPPSLSETHGTSRRKKRNRGGGSGPSGPGGGQSGGYRATGAADSGGRPDKRKMAKVDRPVQGKRIDLDTCDLNGSFNYAEARRRLGLENLYAEKKDEKDNRRGKFSKKPSTSKKNFSQGFDALRRVRQDPKPEGIAKAPRRQVYSMTGNRSATFKK